MPSFRIGRDGNLVVMRHTEVTEIDVSDIDLRALLAEYSELSADDIEDLALEQVCDALIQCCRERDRMTDEIDTVAIEYGITTEASISFHQS
jgi:hypothetical protein